MTHDRIIAAVAGAAALLVAGVIITICWLIERPDGTPRRPHYPRHALDGETPGALTAEMAAADEMAADWTEDQLRSLHGDPPPVLPPSAAWDFAAWEADQAVWMLGARQAANRYDDVLKTGAWSDPWWTRRR